MTTTKRNISAEKLERVAEVLKTIAHPVRLSILEVLQNHGRLTVSDLKEKTQTEQSLLSHHLIKMKDKGVLRANREGKNIYYALVDDHITNIFDCMEKCSFI
ncbi:ArsR/SmtB family transcription factor [Microscilla marina]|uniref:Transcriptional regulator, ArsR family n=1 Tax=Microscilla marina ATCC 23134 TaxID=313606 RepID=A1ZVS6_MICM2|nr:metalloregulator ArsR/SmtB family transcription factor [Microscilla marina]EAY25503.1 transcriptional regulator, ArsR family [Microscilla marina ATCC 23134]